MISGLHGTSTDGGWSALGTPQLFYCVSKVWRFRVRRNEIESKLGCMFPIVFVSFLRAKYERMIIWKTHSTLQALTPEFHLSRSVTVRLVRTTFPE